MSRLSKPWVATGRVTFNPLNHVLFSNTARTPLQYSCDRANPRRLAMKHYNMKYHTKFAAVFLAILVASLVGCASTATQEGTGEYIDNAVITTKVKTAIFNEPTLKSFEINVETFKGAVQLSGFVNSQADIDKAVEIVQKVKGVKSVKNDMQLK
jgi:osmotically-inducible protein OsmY